MKLFVFFSSLAPVILNRVTTLTLVNVNPCGAVGIQWTIAITNMMITK